MTHRQARPTGIGFVDATKIQVCHQLRIPRQMAVLSEEKKL